MNDEPLDIDDRSPGERMIAGGRASVSRAFADQRLDVAALLWMLCTVASLGAGIYSAWQIPGDGFPEGVAVWDRIAVLAGTGGFAIALSCMVGIALAVWFETASARGALWLATIGGVWVFIAAGCWIASTFHEDPSGSFVSNSEDRVVGLILGVADAGLGLIVMMIAWRRLQRRRRLN